MKTFALFAILVCVAAVIVYVMQPYLQGWTSIDKLLLWLILSIIFLSGEILDFFIKIFHQVKQKRQAS